MDNTKSNTDNQEKHHQSFYYIIPAILVEDSPHFGIGLLYGLITSLCNKEGFCFASNNYLAQKLKTSSSTIKRYLKFLLDNDYVEINTYQNKGNTRKIYIIKRTKVGSPMTQPRVTSEPTPRVTSEPHSNISISNIKKSNNKVDQSKTYPSEVLELTTFLHEFLSNLKLINKNSKKSNWYKDINLFIKEINLSIQEIKEIINFIPSIENNYLKTCIRSAKALREKFVMIHNEYNRNLLVENNKKEFQQMKLVISKDDRCKEFSNYVEVSCAGSPFAKFYFSSKTFVEDIAKYFNLRRD